MLGLIKRLIKDLTNSINAVDRWVLKLIHAIYSYVDRLFSELRQAVNDVHQALNDFERAIRAFAGRIYVFAHWITQHVIPDVVAWVRRGVSDLTHAIDYVLHWAEKWVTRILNDIINAVRSLTAWVIKHIYQPLFAFITHAWHWITHEGYTVWYFITHPDKLAARLAKYVWMNILVLPKRYATPIAKWLLHQMPGLTSTVIDVMEHIVSAIL